MKDAINPQHYQRGGIEAYDVIRAFDLAYPLGNVVKYVLRAGRKDPRTLAQDLRKARWYLDRYIAEIDPDVETIEGESPEEVKAAIIDRLRQVPIRKRCRDCGGTGFVNEGGWRCVDCGGLPC
jgi:hypothetical protein